MISCEESGPPKLVIASAANVQFVMDEIVSEFTQRTGINCDVIISSSGKLTAQIIEGAPFDVFISADLAYPQKIADADLAVKDPVVYAHGKLVLWSMRDDVKLILKDLGRSSTRYIALANPEVAPYGRAAKEVLEYYTLYDDVQKKLVYGESIAQVNQFVISEAVDAGFTAKSVVLSPQLKGQGIWMDIDPEAYNSIEQGFIILSNSHLPNEAKSFEEFFAFGACCPYLRRLWLRINLFKKLNKSALIGLATDYIDFPTGRHHHCHPFFSVHTDCILVGKYQK
ncbi:MAG: molybdate ABC transporter substrate-binding protein [Saprospiraceae bacterium]|nr:molybdate ABC transporter substrate-binding protein [Saprospiraceae bacterium]